MYDDYTQIDSTLCVDVTLAASGPLITITHLHQTNSLIQNLKHNLPVSTMSSNKHHSIAHCFPTILSPIPKRMWNCITLPSDFHCMHISAAIQCGMLSLPSHSILSRPDRVMSTVVRDVRTSGKSSDTNWEEGEQKIKGQETSCGVDFTYRAAYFLLSPFNDLNRLCYYCQSPNTI